MKNTNLNHSKIILFIAVCVFGVHQASADEKFPVRGFYQFKNIGDGGPYQVKTQDRKMVEVIELGETHSKVHLFDANGSMIQGEFSLSNKSLEKIVGGDLKANLEIGYEQLNEDDYAKFEEEYNKAGLGEVVMKDVLDETMTGIVGAQGKGGAPYDVCSVFPKFKAANVPLKQLKQALTFYQANMGKGKLQKSRYVGIANYEQNSKTKRFYLLDMETGLVIQEKVSHGGGKDHQGDPSGNGTLKRCVNSDGSHTNMTRVGFFAAGEYYDSSGHHGKWPNLANGVNGLRLDGLSPGVNKEARDQGVVMHEAYYNQDGNVPMGRSWGCPAFVPGKGAPIIKKLAGGGLLYGYAPICGNEMSKVLKQVQGWENLCGSSGKDDGPKEPTEDQNPSKNPKKKVKPADDSDSDGDKASDADQKPKKKKKKSKRKD